MKYEKRVWAETGVTSISKDILKFNCITTYKTLVHYQFIITYAIRGMYLPYVYCVPTICSTNFCQDTNHVLCIYIYIILISVIKVLYHTRLLLTYLFISEYHIFTWVSIYTVERC